MFPSFETASAQVLALLNAGSCDAVTGRDITIRHVWCADDHQVGTGCDEHGRPVVFSLSLSTGRGLARVM